MLEPKSISYLDLYEVLNRQAPIHWPLDSPVNLYALNSTVAVVALLERKGIKVEGCRADIFRAKET